MENFDLPTVAEEFRKEGYQVILEPSKGDLPDFLAGMSPDLLAWKDGENVVVEFVTKAGLRRRKQFLEYWVGRVNARPDWRFDLVINPASPWSDEVAVDVRDPDIEHVRGRIEEARRTLGQGFLEPACLFAWALAEAAMRIVARALSIPLKSNTASRVMKQLYASGAISNEDLEKLLRLMTVRNSVAHGLETSSFGESVVEEVIAMAEKLLAVAEDSRRRVAGA